MQPAASLITHEVLQLLKAHVTQVRALLQFLAITREQLASVHHWQTRFKLSLGASEHSTEQ